MNAKDAIRGTMDLSLLVLKGYVGDLDDEQLMRRPGTGCNHLAWQLGHLIASEVNLLDMVCPGAAAPLPDGFAEQHNKETAGCDDRTKFLTKDQYLALFETVRGATIAALEKLPDEQLDAPGPEHFRDFCPTVGSLFGLIASHPMMHAGQAVPIRRALGKPVLF